MKKYFLLSSTFLLLNYGVAEASNNTFEVNLGTHTHLPQLELSSPSLNPDGAYKTARVCSLANENCNDDIGFNKSDKDTSSGAQKCKNSGYNITSCPAPKLLSQACKTHSGYFKGCICPATLSLNTTEYCTTFCDGKCVAKANCPTNQIHTSALSGCYQPACSEGGFRDSVPSNNKCSSTTYYGRTCYKDCYQPQCSEGGYNSYVPSNNKCSSTNYYGRTCYLSCYQPSCSEGGYHDSTPSGQSCSNTSYYGRTCYTNCQNETPPANNCYWNSDGTRYISSGAGCYDGYGASATIVLPSSGITVSMAGHSFWQRAVVQGGPLRVNGDLWVGMHANLQAAHATFNVPVTVNGTVYFSPGSTMSFNNGISGSYVCKEVSNNWNTVRSVSCPF